MAVCIYNCRSLLVLTENNNTFIETFVGVYLINFMLVINVVIFFIRSMRVELLRYEQIS